MAQTMPANIQIPLHHEKNAFIATSEIKKFLQIVFTKKKTDKKEFTAID